MYWPIAALAWWGAERAWRFVTLLWVNGVFEGIWINPRGRASRVRSSGGGFETSEKQYEAEPALGLSTLSYPPASSPYSVPYGGASPALNTSPAPTLVNSTNSPRPLPPAGFATAQLLPGRTVRLTIHTPHAVRWAAGQHLLLYVPGVRLFESHPYTIAGVDERAKQLRPVGGKVAQRGSEIVLLVRAQKGFSRALWDYIVRARGKAVGPRKEDGVLLRTLVSWPMGSSGRVTWGAYDTLLIVCGGTGITFGISVLESACRRMVRKEQVGDKKWKTTRVRFVWIMREYGESRDIYTGCICVQKLIRRNHIGSSHQLGRVDVEEVHRDVLCFAAASRSLRHPRCSATWAGDTRTKRVGLFDGRDARLDRRSRSADCSVRSAGASRISYESR